MLRSKYLLGLLIASLLAIYGVVGLTQYRQYREFDRIMRQGDINAMWAFAQLAVEYERLNQALYARRVAADSVSEEEALQLRYEVFVSRIGVADAGTPRQLMDGHPTYVRAIQQLRAFTERADGVIAAASPQQLGQLQEQLASMREIVRQLSVEAAQATGTLIDRRNQVLQQQTREAAVITALQGMLTLLLAGAMAYQFRKRERAQAMAMEAQTTLVESLRRSEEALETRVQQRTADLQAANESLRLQESELVTARSAAEESSRLKSNFLANMSHEIRSPLNAVIGMSHLMLGTRLSAQQRDYAEKIQRSGQHLLGLINDILDFSKIEAGHMDVETVEFTLQSVLEGLSDQVGTKAADKGLSLVFDIAPDLPPRLRGDPLRVGQILINYVNNAIKFTEAGRIVVRMNHVALGGDDVLLRGEVHDTGIGLSGEQLGGLFKPFQQADASITRKFGGTGLGLAISRHLAELMGGEVGASSVPGQGSTFWFTARLGVVHSPGSTLPSTGAAHVDATMRSSDASATSVPDAWPRALRGAKVLLVDDIDLNQQVGRDLLHGAGIDVDVASNGEEALSRLATKHYDVVLMDMQMPVMDGLTATRRIRQDPRCRTLPVIAMTANAMAADRARCLEAGMNDHLPKPIDPTMLFQTLQRWIPPQPPGEMAMPCGDAAAGTQEASRGTGDASPALMEVEGLDVASALPRMQFRMDRYRSMLQRFVQGQEEAVSQARLACYEGRQSDALRILHTLKGTAATIGARVLAGCAEEAENALRAGTSAEKLQDLWSAAESCSRQLTSALRTVLAEVPWPEHRGEPGSVESCSATVATLHHIMELVEQDSPDAVDLLQQAEGALRRDLGAAYGPLAEALSRYDFESGRELLQRALASAGERSPGQ